MASFLARTFKHITILEKCIYDLTDPNGYWYYIFNDSRLYALEKNHHCPTIAYTHESTKTKSLTKGRMFASFDVKLPTDDDDEDPHSKLFLLTKKYAVGQDNTGTTITPVESTTAIQTIKDFSVYRCTKSTDNAFFTKYETTLVWMSEMESGSSRVPTLFIDSQQLIHGRLRLEMRNNIHNRRSGGIFPIYDTYTNLATMFLTDAELKESEEITSNVLYWLGIGSSLRDDGLRSAERCYGQDSTLSFDRTQDALKDQPIFNITDSTEVELNRNRVFIQEFILGDSVARLCPHHTDQLLQAT